MCKGLLTSVLYLEQPVPAPDHHPPRRGRGRPEVSAELHVPRRGPGPQGEHQELPQDRGDPPGQGTRGPSSQRSMPKIIPCKYHVVLSFCDCVLGRIMGNLSALCDCVIDELVEG